MLTRTVFTMKWVQPLMGLTILNYKATITLQYFPLAVQLQETHTRLRIVTQIETPFPPHLSWQTDTSHHTCTRFSQSWFPRANAKDSSLFEGSKYHVPSHPEVQDSPEVLLTLVDPEMEIRSVASCSSPSVFPVPSSLSS